MLAAEELAREAGPGNLVLDAVAAKAGVSKGGLLYHFPTKAKLLEALVEQFLAEFDGALNDRERESGGAENATTRAYLDIMVERAALPPAAAVRPAGSAGRKSRLPGAGPPVSTASFSTA